MFEMDQATVPRPNPSVQQAFRELYRFVVRDMFEEPYVLAYFRRLEARWPGCSSRDLVKNMIDLGLAQCHEVGSGRDKRLRLYLTAELPPDPRTRRMLKNVRPFKPSQRIEHGRIAICVEELEYRVLRLFTHAAEPQPSGSWDVSLLTDAERFCPEDILKRTLVGCTPALLTDVLTHLCAAKILQISSDVVSRITYELAMNPDDIVVRQLAGSRPVYEVSSTTLERIETARSLARYYADAHGYLNNIPAFRRFTANAWRQTEQNVKCRVFFAPRNLRTARSAFEILLETSEGMLPVSSVLGWCDLVVNNAISDGRARCYTVRTPGFARVYDCAQARYAS